MPHVAYRGKKKQPYVLIEFPHKPDGSRDRRWVRILGCHTDREVQSKAIEMENQARYGEYVDGGKHTFSELMTKYLTDRRGRVKERSYWTYERLARLHILPYLGSKYVSSIRASNVHDIVTQLQVQDATGKQRLGSVSVRQVFLLVNAALNFAVALQWIRKNPATSLKPPIARSNEREIYSMDELRRVRAAVAGTSLALPFMIALSTGMREGEICALAWRDVDLVRGFAKVSHSAHLLNRVLTVETTKNKRTRPITIPPTLLSLLVVQKESSKSQWVYPEIDGTMMNPANLCKRWGRVVKSLGIDRTFHDLRHTHATGLIDLGFSPKAVSDRIGDNIGTVMEIYTHSPRTEDDPLAKAVEAIFFGDG